MLSQANIGGARSVQEYDFLYRGPASFVGYPVTDGSVGSSFLPRGSILSISSACRNKEAAWEFVREILLPRWTEQSLRNSGNGDLWLPINREDYELINRMYASDQYSSDTRYFSSENTQRLTYHPLTEDEIQRFEKLYDSIEKIEMCDNTLYSLVLESCGPYFAGDRTLDDTISLIQNRAQLYVNELR